jgi:hypothetical protein
MWYWIVLVATLLLLLGILLFGRGHKESFSPLGTSNGATNGSNGGSCDSYCHDGK